MKVLKTLLAVWFILFAAAPLPLQGEHDEATYPVAYFYHPRCASCREIEDRGYIDELESQVEVERYDIADEENHELLLSYLHVYESDESYPIVFAGEDYYFDIDEIGSAVEDGSIAESARDPLLDVEGVAPEDLMDLDGFAGFIRVVIAGLIDGINPCAIAMLLMFLSMVAFVKSRKALLLISVSYIAGIFLTYLTIGLFLLEALRRLTFIEWLATGLYAAFALLSLVLFLVTFRDFLATRRNDYGNVRNQLPSRLRRFNERFMSALTAVVRREEHPFKRTAYLIFVPFLIGVVIGLTEAVCTGQIYLVVLFSIRTVSPALGRFYLVIFNLLFILPLILIAIAAVRSRDILSISAFVRRRMPLVKLLTSLFFFAMMIYFISQVLGVPLFGPALVQGG